MSLNEMLAASPIVPVVVVNSPEEGVQVGKALLKGGIKTAEVCFRTDAAEEAIKEMCQIPELTVGAGTVINPKQAETAIAAGAQFIVSPGFSAEVVKTCQANDVPALPACTDGSWIMAALELGIEVVKFFPASNFGGIGTIKSLSAAFPGLGFMPTGGVSAANLAEYLAVPSIRACGGSWMVKGNLVEAQDWETISKLSAEAMAIAKEVRK